MRLKNTFKYKTLIWDIETDGLLNQLTRVHILVIKEFESGQRWVFHRNRREDTILEGVRMLNDAECIVGHNIIGFDMEALWKIFGDEFNPRGKVRDTLVMTRMLFADEKERDIRRWKRGQLEGKYIGSHELAAWGQRLGYPKDDYTKRKKEELREKFPDLSKTEIDRLVWATWSQDMEDYAVIDVEVTDALWAKIVEVEWSEEAVVLEHRVHDLMERVTRNGFPFDMQAASALENALREECETRTQKAIDHFGMWWVPAKWYKGRPREDFGEDKSRDWWGEVTVPKRSVTYKDPAKADRMEGCGFCPIKLKEFNPNSRPMIIDRLQKIYGWEPQEFTEKGTPKVDDEVLRDLAATQEIWIADDLAEVFYLKKRLGQLIDGKAGWIGKALEQGDQKIHPRIIVGGTVTNRASHSGPNIAQVPRVVFKKLPQFVEKDVSYRMRNGRLEFGIEGPNGVFDTNLTPLLGPDGKQIIGVPVYDTDGSFVLDEEGKVKTKKTLMKGRAGDHGYECRQLFKVPDDWILMGSDQKGIELRCLGHYMAEFDDGEYGRLCVESDPHDLHQAVMELDSRDVAKTFIYATIYGAGPYKQGITIDATLANKPAQAKALGAEMNRRIMTRIPALGALVKNIQREAKRGYVTALDGRRLFVRKAHAALNTKLQGAGATISKKWCVLFEEYMEDAGLNHGWNGDFAILAWVHDELQVALRDEPKVREIAEECIKRAARDAGKSFDFCLPVDVDVKFGRNWAETH